MSILGPLGRAISRRLDGGEPIGRLLAIEPRPGEPRELTLFGRELSLGSEPTNDLTIPVAGVSKRHAIIRRRAGRLEVTDLDSTNGTFVNGRRIRGRTALERGDELRIGPVRFVLAAPSQTAGNGANWVGGRKWVISRRALGEIVLVAFAAGFGVAQYLAYLMYAEQDRLLLGEAVPVPAAASRAPQAPSRLAPAPPGQSAEARALASVPRSASSASVSMDAGSGHEYKKTPAGATSNLGPGQLSDNEALKAAVYLTSLIRGSGTMAGKPAPGFVLRDLAGHSVSLSALRGKVVFLNVWATWCPVCRREMPALEKLYAEFSHYPDFQMLAVSEDQNPAQVAPFIERAGYRFPVLLDPTIQVGTAYQVVGLPSTFVIDRNGRIIWNCTGGLDWSSRELREAVGRLL